MKPKIVETILSNQAFSSNLMDFQPLKNIIIVPFSLIIFWGRKWNLKL